MSRVQPRILQPEELAALPLEGRAFRSREGLSHFRGQVRRIAFEDGMVCVDVADVLWRHEEEGKWAPHKDFSYHGNPMVTLIFQERDGGVSIDITHIGQIKILPEGVQ